MKIDELIEKLKKYNPDFDVCTISHPEEMNVTVDNLIEIKPLNMLLLSGD